LEFQQKNKPDKTGYFHEPRGQNKSYVYFERTNPLKLLFSKN